jgi:Tfp pilus assembly protein PilO
MIIKQKKQILIYIIIFGFFALIFIFFLIYPLFQKIKRNSEDFLSTKKELISLEVQSKNLGEFKEIYQENLQNIEKINNLFINPEVPIDFIGFLEKISQDSKVSIKISLLSTKEEKDIWPSLQFQISATGSFNNFSKFLKRIDTTSYLVEIKNININRLTEDELKTKGFEGLSSGDIKATIVLKVYTKEKSQSNP